MTIGKRFFFSSAERPRVMAYTGMALGLCPPLATLVGGQLHVHLGWRSVFWVTAAAGVLWLLVWAVLGKDGPISATAAPTAEAGKSPFATIEEAIEKAKKLAAEAA